MPIWGSRFQPHSHIWHFIPSPFRILWEGQSGFYLFLHLHSSVHGKLFCTDKLSRLTALHPLTPQELVQGRCHPCSSPQLSTGKKKKNQTNKSKNHSTWGWARGKELWWALIHLPAWMTGRETRRVHHETCLPIVGHHRCPAGRRADFSPPSRDPHQAHTLAPLFSHITSAFISPARHKVSFLPSSTWTGTKNI